MIHCFVSFAIGFRYVVILREIIWLSILVIWPNLSLVPHGRRVCSPPQPKRKLNFEIRVSLKGLFVSVFLPIQKKGEFYFRFFLPSLLNVSFSWDQ